MKRKGLSDESATSKVARWAWFAARLQFKSSISGRSGARRLWEETIVVLRSGDDAAARKKAATLGRRKQHSYKNKYGEIVSWHFQGVKEIVPLVIDRIADGAEVYYRFFRRLEKGGDKTRRG